MGAGLKLDAASTVNLAHQFVRHLCFLDMRGTHKDGVCHYTYRALEMLTVED